MSDYAKKRKLNSHGKAPEAFPSSLDVFEPPQGVYAVKKTVRMYPISGTTFVAGQNIVINLTKDAFVNMRETYLEFDLTLQGYGTNSYEILRLQNGATSILNQGIFSYGATPIETIPNFNVISRFKKEWQSPKNMGINSKSVLEGWGEVTWGPDGYGTGVATQGPINIRQAYIQGIDNSVISSGSRAAFSGGYGFGVVKNSMANVPAGLTKTGATFTTNRYRVRLDTFGVFNQDKLFPPHHMDGTFQIQMTLEQNVACLYCPSSVSQTGALPAYGLTNVSLVCETLNYGNDFDNAYRANLSARGLPIKINTWLVFQNYIGGSTSVNQVIPLNARSVKSLFTGQRRNPPLLDVDSHALICDTSQYSTTGNAMQSWQYRVGTDFYPVAPTQQSLIPGGSVSNGAAEALQELQKACSVIPYFKWEGPGSNAWALPPGPVSNGNPNTSTAAIQLNDGGATFWAELDWCTSLVGWNSYGSPLYMIVTNSPSNTTGNSFSGNLPSSMYMSATNVSTSQGVEISGINTERAGLVMFMANWSAAQSTSFLLETYAFVDAIIHIYGSNDIRVDI